MTADHINVEETIQRVKDLVAKENDLSPALKASIDILLLLVTILVNRLGLNSMCHVVDVGWIAQIAASGWLEPLEKYGIEKGFFCRNYRSCRHLQNSSQAAIVHRRGSLYRNRSLSSTDTTPARTWRS